MPVNKYADLSYTEFKNIKKNSSLKECNEEEEIICKDIE